MPDNLKNVIEKFKTKSFNFELYQKYRFYKKYGLLNVDLLK